MLKVKQLQTMRNGRPVLSNINLHIKAGESCALQGTSGCGKSTLLKTLVGGCQWQAESFVFNEQEISPGTIRIVRQSAGYIGQESILSGASVKESLKQPFLFEAYRNKPFPQAELNRLTEKFKLPKSLLSKHPSELSGGQRQRFCIIRTLLLDPKLIIADEPTSALDSNNRDAVIDELLHQQRTVISTSHDKHWLDSCDKIIRMREGSIIRENEYV